MPHVHVPYPSCRYHATEPAKLVRSEEEDKALGPGWHDSPLKCVKPEPKSEEKHEEKPAKKVK